MKPKIKIKIHKQAKLPERRFYYSKITDVNKPKAEKKYPKCSKCKTILKYNVAGLIRCKCGKEYIGIFTGNGNPMVMPTTESLDREADMISEALENANIQNILSKIEVRRCEKCGGTGKILSKKLSYLNKKFYIDCSDCSGSGHIISLKK